MSYYICSEAQIVEVQCKTAYIWRVLKSLHSKSKSEIINQNFILKNYCFIFNSHSECTVPGKLSGYKLEKRNVSKVKLFIKALLKCQKQLHYIEELTPKEIIH